KDRDAPVVVEKIIGFPVCQITDRMPVLLQVMAEMNTPGGVPQPFAAHNKQYPHFFISSQIRSMPRWHYRRSRDYGRPGRREDPASTHRLLHIAKDCVSLSIM